MAAAPKMLTLKELAKYLRVHRSTVHRLLKRREIPGFKIGGSWRFSIEEVKRRLIRSGDKGLDRDVPVG